MKKYHSFLALLLAVLIGLSSCAASPAPVQQPEPAQNTVTDCAGRTVPLPDSVDSIACLYAYTGHVSVLLGCEDRITAVVKGLKRDALMERKVTDLTDMPCPYNGGAINMEELAAVAPDLIFLRTENLQNDGEIEKLDRLGIPYVVIDYVTMEDQLHSIDVMGKALGCQDRADAYTAFYRSTMEEVRKRVADIPEEQRKTVYHSVKEVVRTDIPDTLSFEILEAAGCRNVVASSDELKLDGDKGMATIEQIYVWDPDIILSNEPDATAYFRTDSKFSGLRAVMEGNVFQLPVGISRWAHPGSVESPLAALYIAKLLYPEAFADLDMAEAVKDFYQTFLNLPLSEEDIQMILCGEGMRSP